MKNKIKKLKKLKLCLVCSAGGHLTEISHLKNSYSKYPHFFITFKRQDTTELKKNNKVYFVKDPSRNIIKFLMSIFQNFLILLKEKPRAIISTGAGVAVPTCYLGKFLLKSKIIFVESFCRIKKPSLSGKIVFPIADLFFVQWEELLKKYGNKVIYRGAIV